MPTHPTAPTLESLLNEGFERIRALERRIASGLQEPFDAAARSAYTWQSAATLATGFGHRLYTERPGHVEWIRAERSSGDGTSTAILDVYHNGSSLFQVSSRPTIPSGQRLGSERMPDHTYFKKGDNFRVEIVDTGGGTGPIRVTIRFRASLIKGEPEAAEGAP